MENLTIHDPSPQQGAPMSQTLGRAPPPQQPQQLPPQMFTTAAQLLDLTDKKLLICLRDGRKLTGILRSWDQFGTFGFCAAAAAAAAPLVSAATTHICASAGRHRGFPVKGYYADKSHGIFLVRGENVLLLGEIDLDKDDDTPAGYEMADFKAVERMAKEKKATDKSREKNKLKKLSTLGFEGENLGEILL
ncbi:hypothetical protein PG997_000465 [Apiospora hydei]|uniref:U6 snRNA-associated Sm-like protein LSm1 n=1 Tax=Apiospora hydei TaxID=1337664 RepID=A0ABR1XAV4_9PEZI